MLPWNVIIPAIVLSALAVVGVLMIAARRVHAVRPWLVVAAVGVAAMPVAIVLHNILSALFETEEGASFVVAVTLAPLCIAAGIIGGAVVLLREQRDLGIPVAIAAGGLALFAAGSLFNLIVTTVWGERDYQTTINAIAVPLSTVAAVVGAGWSALALAVRGRRTSTA